VCNIQIHIINLLIFAFLSWQRRFQLSKLYSKVKQSRKRPGVAQRVPGGLGSQTSMTFGTWRWRGFQAHAPSAFTPRKCSWYSFSRGDDSKLYSTE